MAKMSFTTVTAQRRIDRIQHLLRREYLNINEIADGIYMSVTWARAYIKHLHAQRCVHIYEWQYVTINGKRYWKAVYAWGNAKDAKRPVEDNSTYRRRRYAERKRDDPEWHDRQLAKLRAARWKPQADPLTQWIPRAT
jgi:hypothetical protein